MMQKKFLIYVFIPLSIQIIISCCSSDVVPESQEGVELYLLESYETTEDFSAQIDEETIMPDNNPLIKYEDLRSYNSGNYTFSITEKAKSKILNLEHPVYGLAFVVMVDKVPIYTGYFWPAYSSVSCDWVVIDPTSIGDDNKMQVRLGYPGPTEGISIPDNRNDPKLLEVFRRDRKLIE